MGAYIATHRIMVMDEFFALNLLRDPSWRHALASWNRGADSGGLLYYLLLRPVALHSRSPVFAVKLFSSAAYVLSAFVWWRVLSRFVNSWSSALGILLVWLSCPLFLLYLALVRFYTPLVLFAAVAAWATLRASDPEVSARKAALLVFLGHLGLILIHMLGGLYSGLLMAAVAVCVNPLRRCYLILASAVAAWTPLLLFRTAIHAGSLNATSQGVPVMRDILRFFFKFSAPFPVLLIAGIGVIALFRQMAPRILSREQRADLRFRGPLLCTVFAAAPFVMYVASQFGHPLAENRYFLPYLLALATFTAMGVELLRSWRGYRTGTAILAAAGLLIIPLHLQAIRRIPSAPTLDLGSLRSIAAGRPVVLSDGDGFFALQYYDSGPGLQFHLLIPPLRANPLATIGSVYKSGYFPNNLDLADSFARRYSSFLLMAWPGSHPFPWPSYTLRCHIQPVGVLPVTGIPDHLFTVDHCLPPSGQRGVSAITQ